MAARATLNRIDRTVFAGVAAWAVLLVAWLADVRDVTLIRVLLGLGPAVILPLGTRLIAWTNPLAERLRAAALQAMPAGALAVVVAILLPEGLGAATAASAWLAVCAILSVSGLVELLRRPALDVELLVKAAACGYASVGGGWFVLSRYGANPLGFGDAIVELTAVHFHIAAVGAPLVGIIAAAVARRRSPTIARACEAAAVTVVASMPIVALGQTSSQTLEVVGSSMIGLALCVLAAATLTLIVRTRLPALSRILLVTSSGSVAVAMVLAVDFAVGGLLGTPVLSIDSMARTHGVLNGIGFALCGLLGWRAAIRAGLADR